MNQLPLFVPVVLQSQVIQPMTETTYFCEVKNWVVQDSEYDHVVDLWVNDELDEQLRMVQAEGPFGQATKKYILEKYINGEWVIIYNDENPVAVQRKAYQSAKQMSADQQ